MKHTLILLTLSLLFLACANTSVLSMAHPKATLLDSNKSAKQYLAYTKPTKDSSLPQKRADSPKDSGIQMLDESGKERCYLPARGEVGALYLSIGTCRTSWVRDNARYDVFGRIAYKINEEWYCITMPEEVFNHKKENDYVTLTPCVINDKKQQWKLKDNIFYSLDELYSLKDDGTFVYAAHKLNNTLKVHKLSPKMKEWANTIAQPGNLSILTSLAWDLETKDGKERYFLSNNESLKNTTPMYYNLETGHLAIFNEYEFKLECLYSNNQDYEWNWTFWDKCDNTKNNAFWSFVLESDDRASLKDKQGNYLRLTRYGTHWGVPYTTKPSYIKKDTSNSPTSSFIIDTDMQDWLRFIDANIGKNLPFCPAPSYNKQELQRVLANVNDISNNNVLNNNIKRNIKNAALSSPLNNNPPLPPNFTLSPEWLARLRAITLSADGSNATMGICGICLLQAYQMIAELLENPLHPRTSGGYFFDTQEGINPFISFQNRNSLLYESLEDILSWYRVIVDASEATEERVFEHSNNLALVTAISMLAQYNWTLGIAANSEQEVLNAFDNLLAAPNGSVFILLMRLTLADRNGPHAMVALRLANGVVLLPTNISDMSEEDYRNYTEPLRTRQDFIDSFDFYGARVTRMALLRVSGFHQSLFANTLSFNDCTGDGEDRRGSGVLPRSMFVNQCLSGRCLE